MVAGTAMAWVKSRRFPRFQVGNVALVTIDTRTVKAGRIKDISRGGLAFEYFEWKSDTTAPSRGQAVRADIILHDGTFFLLELPCNVIYDKIVADPVARGRVVNRRCGLKFGSFSRQQDGSLATFLDQHAVPLSTLSPDPVEQREP